MTFASDLFHSCYASYYRLKSGWRPEKFIFILSHMRSGSTLLTHLLVSNPAICGYGETRTRYFNRRQFGILTGKVLRTLGNELVSNDTRYVLDKLLHDRFSPNGLDVLRGEESKIVFLLREPAGTLSSLMRGTRRGRGRGDETRALNYYSNRLKVLQQYGDGLASSTACLVTHDQLLSRTEELFRLLESFLGLDSSLKETYQILPTTGVRRIGDPSPNIFSGKIVRDDPESKRLKISPETLKAAEECYENCLSTLKATCISLDAPSPLRSTR